MHALLTRTRSQFSEHLGDLDQLAPDVSAWSVGMHVEHCAMAMARMCASLATSVDASGGVAPCPPVRWSVPRVFVTLTGSIPRGKGKAPKEVVPEASPPRERVLEALAAADAGIAAAASLPEDAWFNHHVFGPFRRDKVLWFMGVHNRHHLKIIRDILR